MIQLVESSFGNLQYESMIDNIFCLLAQSSTEKYDSGSQS